MTAQSDSGATDALLLLGYVLERDGTWMLAHGEERVPEQRRARYDAALERRARGEPVPYIVGTAGFYGRLFTVTPDVLVPRPESEHLVMLALAHLAAQQFDRPPRIVDVGTGSGILAISLALERPDAAIVGGDVSEAALAVARRNARALGTAGRIRFERGDLLEVLSDEGRFDCLVANLPYVRSGDLRPAPDATAFEPRLALDGGADGLGVYRRLLAQIAGAAPARGVTLFLEAGPDTASGLAELARAAFGSLAFVEVHRDYGGRERVVEVRREGIAASPNRSLS